MLLVLPLGELAANLQAVFQTAETGRGTAQAIRSVDEFASTPTPDSPPKNIFLPQFSCHSSSRLSTPTYQSFHEKAFRLRHATKFDNR
jgi:hypothetical protein